MKNKLLNFSKEIGGIGVILMYAVIPGKIGIIIRTLVGFAVPLFFGHQYVLQLEYLLLDMH